MKNIVLAAAVAGLTVAAVGIPGVASARDSGTSLTLSARYYHEHWRDGWRDGWRRGHRRGWWNHYAGCRIVVRHRFNRWGERVVVRKRVCY